MTSIFNNIVTLTKKYYELHITKSSNLTDLIFFVTYKCNFRCKTCFFTNSMDSFSEKDALSIEEIRKFSSSLGNLERLYISGGEPFLRDDLDQICEIFYHKNNVRNLHLPTNGFYTSKIFTTVDKILKKCPEIDLTIGISLDGLKETHDNITGLKGSFEKAIETIYKLSELKSKNNNLSLYIITVVNKLNLNEIISLTEYIKNNLIVDYHGPSPMRGIPYDKELSPPTEKQWRELSAKLMEYRSHWNHKRMNNKVKAFFTNNRIRYLYDIYADVLGGGKLPFECQAGNYVGVIEANGDVRLCELTDIVGNVREHNYEFDKVWFSDKANDMRSKIKECACTHACFLNPSIKMNISALFKSLFLGKR